MRVSQSVYLAMASETLTADAITAQLGIEPDQLALLAAMRASIDADEYG